MNPARSLSLSPSSTIRFSWKIIARCSRTMTLSVFLRSIRRTDDTSLLPHKGFGILYSVAAQLEYADGKTGKGLTQGKAEGGGNCCRIEPQALPTTFRGLKKAFPFSHGSLSVSVPNPGIQAARLRAAGTLHELMHTSGDRVCQTPYRPGRSERVTKKSLNTPWIP